MLEERCQSPKRGFCGRLRRRLHGRIVYPSDFCRWLVFQRSVQIPGKGIEVLVQRLLHIARGVRQNFFPDTRKCAQ